MSVADHGSCSGIVSEGQQQSNNRRASSGTMQLLDRLGHGLVPVAFASDAGEGTAETRKRRSNKSNGKEQQEGRLSARAGGDKGDALRTGVWWCVPTARDSSQEFLILAKGRGLLCCQL